MNKYLLSLIVGVSTLASCTDDTSIIGIGVMPEADNITPYSETFSLTSNTIKIDSVLANTKTCYLGSIIDPEMHVKTTSDFMAQFHLPENFKLPKYESMAKNQNGQIEADSCDLQITFDSYYGDSLTTMKLGVQELSKEHILEESSNYYTNINPNLYVDPNSKYNKTITYTIKDLSKPNKTENQRKLTISLPKEYASNILRQYYENPEFFKNSYQFIHNVCPGFYFKSSGGTGSMIVTKNMALNVYFKHSVKLTEEKDTIIDGMQRFGATEEVIQCSSIDNNYPGNLVEQLIKEDKCTFVKTPASLFTEILIPVSNIVGGEHYNDSINLAELKIRKYNSDESIKNSFDAPSYLLMIRKTEARNFFEKRSLPDSKVSFLSSKFSSALNSYTFSNVGQLITHLKIERDLGAGILKSDNEDKRQQKYEQWEQQNPEWNKVLIIPVKAIFIKATDYYGNPIEKLQTVQHELGLTSAKLEGGTSKSLSIKVVYTRFNQ